jgi:RNA polymerase sigma-70 factor (ECF subfamily)
MSTATLPLPRVPVHDRVPPHDRVSPREWVPPHEWLARPDRSADGLIVEIVAEHGAAMRSYALQLTGDHAAAQDVVQEALVRAWRHGDALTNGRGSVRGWLLTVVRNLVTDAVRARRARPQEVAESATVVPRQRDHAEQVAAAVTVRGALVRLSPEHREVLELVYLADLSVAEASAVLGIPTGTVKSRCHYGLRALRDVLAPDAPEVPAAPAG